MVKEAQSKIKAVVVVFIILLGSPQPTARHPLKFRVPML